ncbi:MAG: T9SS type A sorting domain-containing protein [Flavisolibacter sp.]
MKRIFTYLSTIFLLAVFCQKTQAQNTATSTISMTMPPVTFGAPVAVTDANGFSNQNQPSTGTFTNATILSPTTLYTPSFIYSTAKNSISFALTLSTAAGTGDIDSYSLKVEYGLGGIYDGGGITSLPQPVTTVPTTYYFTMTLSPDLPANTNFRFILTMNVPAAQQNIIASQFALESGAVILPVHFASFSGKKAGSGVQLNWEVGEETNVEKYEIQRSSNARDWTKIGEVAAANLPSYHFQDNQPLNGLGFYRIRNVDLDGKYAYSSIVRMNLSRTIELKAYPQPAADQITVEHGGTDKGILTLSSAGGQIVKTVGITPQTTQTTLNLTGLKSGLYILRFDDGQGGLESLKVIKQ